MSGNSHTSDLIPTLLAALLALALPAGEIERVGLFLALLPLIKQASAR